MRAGCQMARRIDSKVAWVPSGLRNAAQEQAAGPSVAPTRSGSPWTRKNRGGSRQRVEASREAVSRRLRQAHIGRLQLAQQRTQQRGCGAQRTRVAHIRQGDDRPLRMRCQRTLHRLRHVIQWSGTAVGDDAVIKQRPGVGEQLSARLAVMQEAPRRRRRVVHSLDDTRRRVVDGPHGGGVRG